MKNRIAPSIIAESFQPRRRQTGDHRPREVPPRGADVARTDDPRDTSNHESTTALPQGDGAP